MHKVIIKRPKTFKRLVWISISTFTSMVETVKQSDIQRLWWETRGRNHELPYEDQILLCLMYLRSYTTYLYLAAIFQISETTAWRFSQRIENILIKCWLFNLPKRALLQEELETIIIDATETQIQRPKYWQRKYYSGKKKKHTIKTQIVINKSWKILSTKFSNGKKHDKKLYDESKLLINPKTKKQADSWYQWAQDTTSNLELPYKWSKKNKLTKEQKQYNRNLSSQRVKVENKIAEIKCFRIFDQKYRNRRTRFGLRFNLICWFINYEKWFKKN